MAPRSTTVLSTGLPLVSCLRVAHSRSTYVPRDLLTIDPESLVGRGGLQLYLGEVTIREFAMVGEFPVGSETFGGDRMKKVKKKRQTGKAHPVRDSFLQSCAALTLARCLALQQDTPVDFGWPVRWTYDQASFFLPGIEGLAPTQHSYDDVKTCSVWTCTRDEGIQWCTPHWNQLYHLGAVPTQADLRSTFKPDYAHASLTDFIYDPWRDHDFGGGWLVMYGNSDLTYGPDYHGERDKALSTPLSALSVVRAGVALVPAWLMDSGSRLDLVSLKRLSGCQHYVTKGAGITLATAHCEVDVDHRSTQHST